MKQYVAIADSHYNEGQTLVLTTAKKKSWCPMERTQQIKVKTFTEYERALKAAKRASLLLSPEIITLDEYFKIKKQIQDHEDHEEAMTAASHEHFLNCGDKGPDDRPGF